MTQSDAAAGHAMPGPPTDPASVGPSALEHIPSEPVDVCRPAHTLVIQPSDAKDLGLPDGRFSENRLRPAGDLIGALLALDPAPLDVPRILVRRSWPHRQAVAARAHARLPGTVENRRKPSRAGS
jgi:hypothetical protein